MKILVRGKKQNEENYQCTCKDCHTKFAFSNKEARFDSDRDGDVCVVICPVCETDNWINTDVLKTYNGKM